MIWPLRKADGHERGEEGGSRKQLPCPEGRARPTAREPRRTLTARTVMRNNRAAAIPPRQRRVKRARECASLAEREDKKAGRRRRRSRAPPEMR